MAKKPAAKKKSLPPWMAKKAAPGAPAAGAPDAASPMPPQPKGKKSPAKAKRPPQKRRARNIGRS